MPLSLHDTASGTKHPFTPAEPGHARIYVCGPTVYDYAHLGHARCYIVYDVLVRHLRASGLQVTYCRNVTDVDDKIIQRAAAANEDPVTLARRFTDAFHEDMRRLGNLPPDIEPRVTDHLPQIEAMVAALVDKGLAYRADGDVYLSVGACAGYGKLSGRTPDDLKLGASGRVDEEIEGRKRHPADFALWKDAPEGLGWQSPFGRGRPGWHIECSAMSTHHLGATLDLHGGGLDLVFPHHENEQAISEAVTGQPYVRHWMHNGFVEVDKQKMSKSLGNFFTARELFARVEPEAMRYYAMTVHYRSPMNLDWTVDDEGRVTGFPQIEEAERRLEYLYRTRLRIAALGGRTKPGGPGAADEDLITEGAIASALDDDLNMPVALAAAGEFLKRANDLADAAEKRVLPSAEAVAAIERAFAAIEQRLGLGADEPLAFLARVRDRRAAARGLAPSEVEAGLRARAEARARKDFARADEIRAELAARGVELLDGPGGTEWRIR